MRLTQIRRHPVKGIGWEGLDRVTLAADRPLPGDRAWAVKHAGAVAGDDWAPRANFLVVAVGPALAAVTARLDGCRVTLSHPDRPTAGFDLPEDGAALMDWARPLWPEARPAPARLVAAPPEGMADNGYPAVSVLTEASLSALSEAASEVLDPGRFRGNLILDGGAPWAEFDWVGRRLHMGGATLEVTEPIQRCRATEANPATGIRDVNTLAVLRDSFGHQHFGVYARVIEGGPVATGDAARLI